MNNGHTNPTTSIRKSFVTGQTWNPSQYTTRSSTRRWTSLRRA
jgi:peptide/nickel transport system substrate-binding protein